MTRARRSPPIPADASQALLERRTRGQPALLRGREAERLARLCHLMAERFARGGRLIAFGRSPAARSDARHVAVEFVHPVIVGKRALPAIGLAGEGGDLAAQVDLLARPTTSRSPSAPTRTAARRRAALAFARARGCLTIAFSRARRRVGVRAAEPTTPTSARSWSRRSTTCSGSSCTCSSITAGCSPGATRAGSTTPARRASSIRSSASASSELEPVVDDVRRSVLMKAREIGALRAQTLSDNRESLVEAAARAARELRARRQAAGAGQRRLGDRRDGRRRRLPRRRAAGARRGRRST